MPHLVGYSGPSYVCWSWLFDLFSSGVLKEREEPTNIIKYHSGLPSPIGSMYGIYANIGGILMVNVTIYSIHGSYGSGKQPQFAMENHHAIHGKIHYFDWAIFKFANCYQRVCVKGNYKFINPSEWITQTLSLPSRVTTINIIKYHHIPLRYYISYITNHYIHYTSNIKY